MKLLFVCGSLEAGRDGVGDYVRVLARECQSRGATCSLLALHDPHCEQVVEVAEDTGLRVLRLPAGLAWKERMEKARAFRDLCRPDWISVQFVPYGFHPKGVVWTLVQHLPVLTQGRPTHVMLHELWIGASQEASLKERLIGLLQKGAILRLIRKMAPRAISTSNPTYVELLRLHGLTARLLPLFGNIPVVKSDREHTLLLSSRDHGAGASSREKNLPTWTGVFFGTLHPDWQPEPLFSAIRRAATGTGRAVRFLAVGRLGASGEKKWLALAEQYTGSFSFVTMGEQSAEEISLLLQGADFGIAASPWQLIGKSGSAVAMMEHGLPVIVNRDDWHARGVCVGDLLPEPLLLRCDRELEPRLVAGLVREKPKSRVEEVTHQFMHQLKSLI